MYKLKLNKSNLKEALEVIIAVIAGTLFGASILLMLGVF